MCPCTPKAGKSRFVQKHTLAFCGGEWTSKPQYFITAPSSCYEPCTNSLVEKKVFGIRLVIEFLHKNRWPNRGKKVPDYLKLCRLYSLRMRTQRTSRGEGQSTDHLCMKTASTSEDKCHAAAFLFLVSIPISDNAMLFCNATNSQNFVGSLWVRWLHWWRQ